MNEEQYKLEIARATKAKTTMAFMREYFDGASEELYAQFLSLKVDDAESLKNEVITLNRFLVEPQLWLESIIDTGKLAQVELDKIN